MAMLKQEPVKVFAYQDHEAHIAVHMAAAQDPKIQQMVGQSPFAAAIGAALAAHVTEHVAMQYRVEIQKQLGVEMPDPEEALPEDIEREVSRLAAEAAGKLLQRNQAEVAQQAAEQQAKDPLTQIQMKELELKEREVALKEAEAKHEAMVDLERLKLDQAKVVGNASLQEERLAADKERDGANLAARLATQLEQTASKERIEGAKIGLKAAENMVKGATDVGRDRGNPGTD
jgi:hypothetical protein